MMRHLGLFEGIGGFSLAARWMGWETVAWCEWNEFCQKILRHHFPEAEGHGDITKTDFTKYANTIDILTGGFPCQPYSLAGKRKGKEDDRHLWPEMLRAIREIQPRWVVGENVPGLLNWEGGVVLDEIKSDLEASGFEVFPPLILPACSKDTEHRRERLWVVAYHKGNSLEKQEMDYTSWGLSKPGKFTERQPCDVWKLNRETYLTEMVGRIYGVSEWVDRSKAIGNAIVPQVAFELFKSINEYERSTQTTSVTD